MKFSLASHASVLALAGLLAACATVPGAQQAPRYAYYVVPCDTPGAILTGPSVPAAQPAGIAAPPSPEAAAAQSAAPAGAAPPVCIVGARALPRYAYGYSDYRPFYSSYRPFYGSFGATFIGGGYHGGHHGGGYHGGGRH